MSEYQTEQQGNIARQILNTLETFQQQIISALNFLKELPDLVRKVLESINESANRQIRATGEMEIIKKTASLDAKRHQISAENEAILDFKEQLNEDIEYIKERYTKFDDELNEEAKKRIRELDSHLLSLPDNFPKEFIQGYRNKITPLMEKIKNDNELSNQDRTSLISNKLSEVISSIDEFIASRNAFFSKIDDFQQDETVSEKTIYNIPLWTIEADNRKNVFTPGVVQRQNSYNGVSYNYEPESLLQDYHRKISGKTESHLNSILDSLPWVYDKKEKDQLRKSLLKYAEKQYPEKKKYVKKAINQILDNSEIQTLSK